MLLFSLMLPNESSIQLPCPWISQKHNITCINWKLIAIIIYLFKIGISIFKHACVLSFRIYLLLCALFVNYQFRTLALNELCWGHLLNIKLVQSTYLSLMFLVRSFWYIVLVNWCILIYSIIFIILLSNEKLNSHQAFIYKPIFKDIHWLWFQVNIYIKKVFCFFFSISNKICIE